MDRFRKILGSVDVRTSRGLEVGPLNNPLVRKVDGNILYVDYAKSDILRQHPYDSSINPDDIVEVDVVWNERPLKQSVPNDVYFDYAVACHVIEHVPDLIGWLQDLRSVLKPGGLLGLAIPDRRYTFDVAKHNSTIGEMVEAYLLRYRKPSIRQQFDHCWRSKKVDTAELWERTISPESLPSFNGEIALQLAYDQARRQLEDGRYYDSHCWMFTPAMFLNTALTLNKLKLFPFRLESIVPTDVGEFEFFVRLRAEDDPRIVAESFEAVRLLEPETEPRDVQLMRRNWEELSRSRVFRLHQAIRKLLGLPHFL